MIETAPAPRNRVPFQELLSAMPDVAEAVHRFTSEENQRTVLSFLLRNLANPEEPAHARTEPGEPGLSLVQPLEAGGPEGHVSEEAEDSTVAASSNQAAGGKRRTRKRAAVRPLDIDFHPEGKQSLRDLVTEKAPANNFEMNTVAVYYLQEILGVTAIETGHVVAAYIECGWRLPANPDNSVSVTASRRKWLDTSDRKAIRLTYPGRNLVLLDLPKKAKQSA